jgi:hypothetical protein
MENGKWKMENGKPESGPISNLQFPSVEARRVPAYIGVIDTEGTSVLTAYAAEKMATEKVAALLMGVWVSGVSRQPSGSRVRIRADR